MILVVMIFGWFFLSASDYKLLSKHAASSISFLSNYIYYMESGYFESSSYEKWFLHTWSLSVEWQFYIFYPLFLTLLTKVFSISNIKYVLLFSTIIAFIYSIHLSDINPNLSYFNFLSRSWEMLLGGIAFLFNFNLNKKNKKISLFIGVTLIIYSMLFFNEKTLWPSIYTLIPTLGAYLVIVANIQNIFIFKSNLIQIIGKSSYSIYLWHWPIIVMGYFFGIQHWIFIGIPLSFSLGFISYKIIEKRKYFIPKSHFELLKSKTIIFSVIIITLCSFSFFNNGMNGDYRKLVFNTSYDYISRYSKDNYINDKIRKEYREECNFYDEKSKKAKNNINPNCIFNIKNDGILLWGDSHAQALSYGLRKISMNYPFSQITTSACKPSSLTIDYSDEFTKACNLSNTKAIDVAIKQNPKIIIFAQRNGHDKTNYLSIIKKLRENNVTSKFILIGPVPQWNPSLPRAIALRHFDKDDVSFTDISFDKSLLDIDKKIKKLNNNDMQVISILDQLCLNNICTAKVDNSNTPLVWDYGHLTLEGSAYIANKVLKNKIFPER